MRSFSQVSALRAYLQAAREDGKTVGFVPTMGALHEGHLTLMRRARGDCDLSVVSIFVNPTQFGPGEDFEKYPRDLARDSRLAQEIGVDALFTPTVQEMYPEGAVTFVEVEEVSSHLEGAVRPGHFRGVATVCAKLFHIMQPNRAYFGMKDYQQLKVIERMVSDLLLPITIVPVATVREEDGLAMSSRNAYLGREERAAATCLYRALQDASALYAGGERDARKIKAVLEMRVRQEPLAELQYAAIAHPDSLKPLDGTITKAVALLAVNMGATRLIDNIVLK